MKLLTITFKFYNKVSQKSNVIKGGKTLLKDYLKENNISILALSREAKIAPSDLSQALNGKRPFFPAWRHRLSISLNIPEKVLFPEYAEKED